MTADQQETRGAMPLIHELQITMKDFWPDQTEAKMVNDYARGTTTTISRRLFDALKTYAAEHELQFSSLVEQLHDEVHGKPVDETDADAQTRPLLCQCGGAAQITEYLDADDNVKSAKVRCTKCHGETHGASQEDAIKRWHDKNPPIARARS